MCWLIWNGGIGLRINKNCDHISTDCCGDLLQKTKREAMKYSNYGVGIDKPLVVIVDGQEYQATFKHVDDRTAQITVSKDGSTVANYSAQMRGHEWLQRSVFNYFSEK